MNKSIDGLQRKTTGGRGTKSGRSRTTTSSVMKRRKSTQKVATKQLGLNDSKAELRAMIAEGEKLERLNQSEKERITAVEDDDFENKEAIKEYLGEIQDVDPTDLVEVPQKEKTKGWFKQQKNKKAKRVKDKKKKRGLKWVIILVIVGLLVAGGAWVYFYLNDFVSQITNGGNIINVILADPDTPLEKDENGRTNILIFGTEGYSMDDPNWDGGYLTDSMMMVSINQDTGDMKAVSLPRDLKSKTCTSTSKINEVFWCKYMKVTSKSTDEEKRQYEEEGAAALEAVFEEVFGVEIQYHVHANWQAVIQVVDALGGIDVVFLYGDQTWDGDETVIYTTDKRGLADGKRGNYHLQYGNSVAVHLTGEQALAVARARNAYGGYGAGNGNFSREYFQQRIIEAIMKKAKNSSLDLSKVLAIKSAVGDNLRTNFKDTEIKTLVKLGTNLDFSGLQTISLYDTSDKSQALLTTAMINGISYVVPTAGVSNYSAIQTYMKKKLSSEGFVTEEAKVVVLNGTSAYGIAASEKTYLEDKGYTISSTGNAPSGLSGFDGVKVYQVSASKSKTAEALAKQYDAELETELPDELASYAGSCDFVVIIGNGYTQK